MRSSLFYILFLSQASLWRKTRNSLKLFILEKSLNQYKMLIQQHGEIEAICDLSPITLRRETDTFGRVSINKANGNDWIWIVLYGVVGGHILDSQDLTFHAIWLFTVLSHFRNINSSMNCHLLIHNITKPHNVLFLLWCDENHNGKYCT